MHYFHEQLQCHSQSSFVRETHFTIRNLNNQFETKLHEPKKKIKIKCNKKEREHIKTHLEIKIMVMGCRLSENLKLHCKNICILFTDSTLL